jgi:transposase
MRGQWELSDAQWELIEAILRPKRRADGRGRPWQDTRCVLDGVLWVLGTGAQWRELPGKYPPYQTCHRRFQQWVRSGKLEQAVRLLAGHLWIKGKLNLEEAFVDATFAGAKKGAWPSARPVAAREQRFSLSPLITVFHSRYLFRVLPRTNHNWWKRSWQEASSMSFQRGLLATEHTTQTHSTKGSKKNMTLS